MYMVWVVSSIVWDIAICELCHATRCYGELWYSDTFEECADPSYGCQTSDGYTSLLPEHYPYCVLGGSKSSVFCNDDEVCNDVRGIATCEKMPLKTSVSFPKAIIVVMAMFTIILFCGLVLRYWIKSKETNFIHNNNYLTGSTPAHLRRNMEQAAQTTSHIRNSNETEIQFSNNNQEAQENNYVRYHIGSAGISRLEVSEEHPPSSNAVVTGRTHENTPPSVNFDSTPDTAPPSYDTLFGSRR